MLMLLFTDLEIQINTHFFNYILVFAAAMWKVHFLNKFSYIQSLPPYAAVYCWGLINIINHTQHSLFVYYTLI